MRVPLILWALIALSLGLAESCPPLDEKEVAAQFVVSPVVLEARFVGRTDSVSGNNFVQTAATFAAVHVHKGSVFPQEGQITVHNGSVLQCNLTVELKAGKSYVVFANVSTASKTERYVQQERVYTFLRDPVPLTKKLSRFLQKIVNSRKLDKKLQVQGLQDMVVKEGKRLRLQCRVRGNPNPAFQWYKDGRRLRSDHRVTITAKRRMSRLVVQEARLDDKGIYECQVRSSAGVSVTSRGNVTVTQTLRPKPPATTTVWPLETRPCPAEMHRFCMNGGTCMFIESLGEIACQCANGYRGRRCDNKNLANTSNVPSGTLDVALNSKMLAWYWGK